MIQMLKVLEKSGLRGRGSSLPCRTLWRVALHLNIQLWRGLVRQVCLLVRKTGQLLGSEELKKRCREGVFDNIEIIFQINVMMKIH